MKTNKVMLKYLDKESISCLSYQYTRIECLDIFAILPFINLVNDEYLKLEEFKIS